MVRKAERHALVLRLIGSWRGRIWRDVPVRDQNLETTQLGTETAVRNKMGEELIPAAVSGLYPSPYRLCRPSGKRCCSCAQILAGPGTSTRSPSVSTRATRKLPTPGAAVPGRIAVRQRRRFSYRGASAERRDIIDRLAAIYSRHLIPVTNMIHGKPRFAAAGPRRRGRVKNVPYSQQNCR